MGSAPVIRKLTALHGHILTCVPSMLQAACETALETDTAPMRETYAKRRALVLRRLHAMGLFCPVPEGAFYAFPDIRDVYKRQVLLDELGVFVINACQSAAGGCIEHHKMIGIDVYKRQL